MTDGVESVVEQSVVGGEAGYRVRAAVVLLTASVGRDHVAVVTPVRRHVTSATPASARHDDAATTARRRPSTTHLLMLRRLVA